MRRYNEVENPAKEWMSDKSWGEILRMSELPGIKKAGNLPKDMILDPERWKVLYDAMEPQSERLPDPWHDKVGRCRLTLSNTS